MIPQRLTVTNFMCYRDNVPTLEFEGLHVACLCGQNGHGKTALLDAITWVLWGQARARTQEELIHQGQQNMSVELEFLARDQRYRVNRRYARSARSRQGSTMLELQLDANGDFAPITGNTLRETEARIAEILHMDFETFISTAYLRQGDAGRFTRSRPAERKATLAEVLGLSYYQNLETKSKGESRSIQDQIISIDNTIELRSNDTAKKPELEAELSEVLDKLADISLNVTHERQILDERRGLVESLYRRRDEMNELERRLTQEENELDHLERQLIAQERRATEAQMLTTKEQEIRDNFAVLQDKKTELDRMNQALSKKSTLDDKLAALEKDIAVQQERLAAEVEQLRVKAFDDLTPKANKSIDIQKELQALESELSEIDSLETETQMLSGEVKKSENDVREIGMLNQRLVQDMQETRSKFDMLTQGDHRCPLCQQVVGSDAQEHLRCQYETKGKQSKSLHRKNSEKEIILKQLQIELSEKLLVAETNIERRRLEWQAKSTNLERDREEANCATKELVSVSAEFERAKYRFECGDFASSKKHEKVTVEAELEALGYDSARHAHLVEQCKKLECYEELERKLAAALSVLSAEKQAVDISSQMLSRRQEENRRTKERWTVLNQELEDFDKAETMLSQAQASLKEIENFKENTLVRKGVLEQDLERCEVGLTEVRRLNQKRLELAGKKSIYDELTVTFGKNGIQALIIETCIPQLQADANELLNRLTDNRMSLKLQLEEGRKDSRTGQPSEELLIKIADDVGTRSYETFSGGETFKIDFTLRIALSKLLARRSGAPLPILFIDEGFGSLDMIGQERLTEAIQLIQNDFEKIIVITHIDRIKDAFPVRVEVVKSGLGSTFRVN